MTIQTLMNTCNRHPEIVLTIVKPHNEVVYSGEYTDLPAELLDAKLSLFAVNELEVTDKAKIKAMTIYIRNR